MKRFKFYYIFVALTALFLSSCETDNYADWKLLNEQWLEKHKSDEGFTQTESGLCYKIIHQGILRYPNSSSVVKVNYTGTLIDGTEFESDTYYAYLSVAIDGWQEILLKLRGGGGRCIIYVPSDLAYGEDGSGDEIPPYSTLIFELELVDSYY
jgi:FKBP-type peptidyl-prolyl cis-trans isomerase